MPDVATAGRRNAAQVGSGEALGLRGATLIVAPHPGLEHSVRVISSHSAIQWGDVPAWLASAFTGLSLVIAMVIIWRDRQSRLREQAMQIACWGEFDAPYMKTLAEWAKNPAQPKHGDFPYTVHIANNSPMPINQPMIFLRSITKWEARRRRRWEGQRRRGILSLKPPKDRVLQKVQLGESGRVRPTLQPGERIERTLTIQETPERYLVVVHFGDAAGRFWAKDVRYGTLYTAKRRIQ